MFVNVVGLVIAAAIIMVRGFEILSLNAILCCALAGLFMVLTNYFYFKAVQSDEVSRVIPILYISPIFVAIGAGLWLGEVFSARTYAGQELF